MNAAERCFNLDVSEYYFRLTTESIRLHSNRAFRHSTFREVVDDRAETATDLLDRYEADDMKEHLRIIPSDGDKELRFCILETSAACIDDAIPELEKALGTSVKFADALSLVLYDLVVEANATEVLTKLGLTSEEAEKYRVCLKRPKSNVIPFK
ncbi:hypothetical protein [Sphingomonas lacusdianchii]|uniref:hypothetical protein n=1 Tax=Sphingomonas lacusdianchii TaxID=2917992 RepID=UPI001F56562F|nr:hypothetical protein [Sphingomonas sp. JXJ CY 53]